MVIRETTPALSILLMLAAAGFGAFGSFLYKTGAQRAGESATALPGEPRLWAGVLCYLFVMVFFISAFRNGGSLAVLYPVYASTFLVSAVISLMAFGTPILPVNAAGMVLLVVGMYLMGVAQ